MLISSNTASCPNMSHVDTPITSISKNERKIELCSYGRCYDEIIDKLVIN